MSHPQGEHPPNWQQVFRIVSSQEHSQLMRQPILLQHAFASRPAGPQDVLLTIVSQSIIVSSNKNHKSFATIGSELSFDLKFQVLYQIPRNVNTPAIGVRFFFNEDRGCSFFCSQQTIIEKWITTLSKYLNRLGFHDMFKPQQKLGKGNFACVYEVKRLTDGALFACKAFSKQGCFSSKNGKESLVNQLNIMRALNQQGHPNILHLEGVYESSNSIYVILEVLKGGQLYSLIKSRLGIFSMEDIRTIMLGLLQGLKHMHELRCMHRDIKPENVMMRSDGLTPVIVDFGLATFCDIDKYLFYRCGTPGYVAPQIIVLTESKHVEPVCDIFSTGVIFHLLLTGQALFYGSNYDQVFTKNKQMKINLTGYLYQHIDSKAMDLMKKMLKKHPDQRIKAEDALKHPFFASEKEESAKPGSPCLAAHSQRKKILSI